MKYCIGKRIKNVGRRIQRELNLEPWVGGTGNMALADILNV